MPEPVGDVFARGIPNGPDEDLGEMRTVLVGVLACARDRVVIITPYFLPDDALTEALNVAALRGVQVDIVLPEANNLALVKWASTAMLFQVLERGCRVWMSQPPFDHTKLMMVDGRLDAVGYRANWDPRSLRLNFEFNVECYDRALAARAHRAGRRADRHCPPRNARRIGRAAVSDQAPRRRRATLFAVSVRDDAVSRQSSRAANGSLADSCPHGM